MNKILGTVSPSYEPNNQGSKPTFPCMNPHTLAFQIGGKVIPSSLDCSLKRSLFDTIRRSLSIHEISLANSSPTMLKHV